MLKGMYQATTNLVGARGVQMIVGSMHHYAHFMATWSLGTWKFVNHIDIHKSQFRELAKQCNIKTTTYSPL
jgi:hypothetical protein